MEQSARPAVFIINSLEGGGAERVMVKLLFILENYFAANKTPVHLILLDSLPESQTCPSYLTKTVLNSQGSLVKGYKQLKPLLNRIKPAYCFSFLTRSNFLNVALAKSLGYSAIISERVNTTSHLSGGLKDAISRLLVKLLYKRANSVVAVSEGVKADLVKNYAVPESKVSLLYNPYDIAQLHELASEPVNDIPKAPYIIGVGRLVKNKNFSLLLQAYAKADIVEDLVILGVGDEEAMLKELAKTLGIVDRVHFLGFKPNPYPYVANAEYFVSTSNAEGFPNAIVEAMCLDKPVIATNCESGPAEIIAEQYPYHVSGASEEKNGILCELNNAEGVADALVLFKGSAKRARYVEKSQACAQQFSYAAFHQRLSAILEKDD
ncbi:MAG: glycosyltransferase [Alteromonadaceae bacterium TMED7]|uniref:glycosyltransferase n=1 Tax=Alteromonas sp. TaxID=232 RepID=UPI000B69BFB3|nr:glycosyltransferase [Alteromonas sp.]MAI37128.1 glycosyl transferase [Alteromonas sp.]RPH16070.1 MAG: glycosyltransferase [Alteromonadaceae bacterium TMED7]|tara:strand:- start:12761 stop:13897 length:1137 start_codon:yes stop_codon:yes gene_type:complete